MKFGISKVISTEWDDVKRLIVKVLFRGKLIDGKGDLRTPKELSSYGIDSNPIAGKRAGYAKTGVDGKYYILGYLNTDRKAEPGESRMFSTDDEGGFKFNVWVRKNGEVLIGDSDVPDDYDNFLTKYNEMKEAFDELVEDHNNLVNLVNSLIANFNGHTHATSCGAGAGTAVVTTNTEANTGSESTADMEPAKAEKIKTL
jgi:hypothetical protein